MVNRLLAGLLCSPLSGVVDRRLLLLTVAGRKTGRGYCLPVQYAAGPHFLWVWPGNADQKTWWRNLRAPAAVTLRLRGRTVRGLARVVDGAVEPGEAARGLTVYAGRFPRTAKTLVGEEMTPDRLRAAAKETLLVRIEVDDGTLKATRHATFPHGLALPRPARRRPVVT